jgi:transcription factor SPT20
MKVIIEHLRAGTVPHEILEELLRGGVRFYEGIYCPRLMI